MPFREAHALSGRELRRVMVIWASAGAGFACLWAAALMLVLPGFSGVSALIAGTAITLLGGLFFGLVAFALVALINRAFGSTPMREPARRSDETGPARDRQALPLDPE